MKRGDRGAGRHGRAGHSQVDAGFTDGPWRTALTDYAHALRAALLEHPGALPLIATRPAVTPKTLHTAERGLAMLVQAGFELGPALDALNSLTLFVVAHANSEAHTMPINEAGDPGSVDFLKTLDEQEFPLIIQAARTGVGTDDRTRFSFAITALIHGFGVVTEIR